MIASLIIIVTAETTKKIKAGQQRLNSNDPDPDPERKFSAARA